MTRSLAKKKNHIHRAFRTNDGSGTDFDIKVEVQKALRKYGIEAIIPSQNEKYFGVRPDLISKSAQLVVEIHGSMFGNIHEKNRIQLQDEFKFKTYSDNKFLVIVFDFDLFEFLGVTVEQYIAPILMNLKKLNGLKSCF